MTEARVVIHIGLHKTGSTSIQRFCAGNRDVLADHGVLVPRTGASRDYLNAHRGLVVALRGRPDDELWHTLADEIRDSGAVTALLSAEQLNLFRPGKVRRVHRLLDGFDQRVLMYVRNPLDFMVAACKQNWKAGTHGGSFREFAEARLHRCDYAGTADRWADVFGADAVDIVVFDRVVSEPGLIADLVGRLGLPDAEARDLLAEVHIPGRANVTPTDQAARAQRRLTAIEHRLPDRAPVHSTFHRLRRHVGRQTSLGRLLTAVESADRPVASEADVEWLREAVGPGIDDFGERYLDEADRPLLRF